MYQLNSLISEYFNTYQPMLCVVKKCILDIQGKLTEEFYVRIPYSSKERICELNISQQKMVST